MTHHANSTKRLLATSAGLSLLSLGGLASSAEAFTTYHLDFNALYIDGVAQTGSAYSAGDGTVIDDEWSAWGIDISGTNYRWDGKTGGTGRNADVDATLLLYDTAARGSDQTGRDGDLETGSDYGTTAQGNALIIQEIDYNGNLVNLSTPDDDAKGGEINFDFFGDNGAQKLINFSEFTLIDVEPNEHSQDGVNVYGYDASGVKVLDIDVDVLVNGFYQKYDTHLNSAKVRVDGERVTLASNHDETNKAKDGVKPGHDAQPSFSFEGVTIYQDGRQLGNNAVFRFEIDESYAAAQGLSQLTFQYADVSGAVSGLRWSDVTPDEPEGPQQVPEPSALAGLAMIGAYGVRKSRQRKAEKLAAAMGLKGGQGPQFS